MRAVSPLYNYNEEMRHENKIVNISNDDDGTMMIIIMMMENSTM